MNGPVVGPIVFVGVKLLELLAQFEHEVQFAARVGGRFDGFVVPLQQSLRVGEGPVLFGMRGGGEEEDFGACCFRVFMPEFPVPDEREIAYYEPFELL